MGIRPGSDGNLWFTESAVSQIGMINPTTHAIIEFTIPTANSGPTEITSGPDGNLWLTEKDAKKIGEVQSSSPGGHQCNCQSCRLPRCGRPVTLTATVSSTAGTLTGSVNFLDGATVLNPTPVALDTPAMPLSRSVRCAGGARDHRSLRRQLQLRGEHLDGADGDRQRRDDHHLGDRFAHHRRLGAPVTLTATVSSTAGTLTGSVNFLDGATVLNPTPSRWTTPAMPLSRSVAGAGRHAITAVYAGNSSFVGGTSTAQTVTVNARDPHLGDCFAHHRRRGAPVTLTATVSSTAGTLTGSVNFLDGATVLNPTPVALETPAMPLSRSVRWRRAHAITAVYAGNSSFVGSTSTVQTVTVNAATTLTSVTARPPPPNGGPGHLTATVSSTAGTLAGSVSTSTTTVLNPTPVASTTPAMPLHDRFADAGGAAITAVYAGNSSSGEQLDGER